MQNIAPRQIARALKNTFFKHAEDDTYQLVGNNGGPLLEAVLDPSGNLVGVVGTLGSFSIGKSRVSVLSKGAVNDGVVTYDAICTNGSAIVTSATASFAQSDIGKKFNIVPKTSTGSGPYRGTILSVQSATQFTATANATASIASNGCLTYGTDNGAAINTAITSATAKGGAIIFSEDVFCTTLAHTVPGGCRFEGGGNDYPLVQYTPNRGSVLALVGFPGTSFVLLGSNTSSYASGDTEACIYDMSIDAQNLGNYAVSTAGRRNRVERCTIWRGTTGALGINGPDSWVLNNIIGQQNQGHVLDARTGDLHIIGNVVRQGGNATANINLQNCSNVEVIGNHIFRGGGVDTLAVGLAGPNILINTTGFAGICGNVTIAANELDGTYGPHVKIQVGTTSPTEAQAITIANNECFQSAGFPAATYPVVELAPSASAVIRGLSVAGNVGIGSAARTEGYTAIVSLTGAGTLAAVNVSANQFLDCATVFSGFRPDAGEEGNSATPVSGTQAEYSGTVMKEGTITTGQLLALNATPQTLVAAPGAGKALVLERAELYMPYNSIAYNGIAAGEDLAVRYTNGSGTILAECETTGFLDQATNQTRIVNPVAASAVAPIGDYAPVANAALVLHLLSGEIATGNSPLKYRVWTRTVDTTW